MVTIQVDEQTAKALEWAANAAGVSISELVMRMVAPAIQLQHITWDELESQFIELSVNGSLPTSFTLGEIYVDHE